MSFYFYKGKLDFFHSKFESRLTEMTDFAAKSNGQFSVLAGHELWAPAISPFLQRLFLWLLASQGWVLELPLWDFSFL